MKVNHPENNSSKLILLFDLGLYFSFLIKKTFYIISTIHLFENPSFLIELQYIDLQKYCNETIFLAF